MSRLALAPAPIGPLSATVAPASRIPLLTVDEQHGRQGHVAIFPDTISKRRPSQ
ncbi:MAG: hypothetical protein HLUCCA08_00845 [Rhodobacteraceae bacterium HLUCCA08]|nr:MAG: hypothetical protein HLUCCA08_00845 [Rhodobacteraceae bacterium HLUCCA08]